MTGRGRRATYNDLQQVRHSDHLALTQLLLSYHLLRGFTRPDALALAPPVAALRRTARQNNTNVSTAPSRGEMMADAEVDHTLTGAVRPTPS